MALLYVQRALIFVGVALTIVLALDVASNLSVVATSQADATVGVDTGRLFYYVMLRAGYVLPSVLPISAIVAVLWAEYGLVVGRERQMIAGSGRSGFKSLLPALVFGLLVGVLQFSAMAYIRPAAVEGQGTSGLRYYGAKFSGSTVAGPIWFAANNMIAFAQIRLGSDVALENMQLFILDGDKNIQMMAEADTATPTADPDVWTLSDGSSWDVAALNAGTAGPGVLTATPFTSEQFRLMINPLWLENFDVSPQLLDQETLGQLAGDHSRTPNSFSFRAALDERYAAIVYCAGMALLGATLALLRFQKNMGVGRILGVISYGGIAYVTASAAGMLSSFGNLPAFWGPWIVPLTLLLGCSAYMFWRDWRVFRALDLASRRPEASPQSALLDQETR